MFTQAKTQAHAVDDPKNLRATPRKLLRATAQLYHIRCGNVQCPTVDISLNGICLMVAVQLPIGETFTISFSIIINGKPIQFTGSAKVIYSILTEKGFRTGFQFNQLDSANHRALAEIML